MPNTGRPSSNTAGSSEGASSAYTLDGPPDRIRATGSLARISSTVAVCGSPQETCASRPRAMSCAYWAPEVDDRHQSQCAPLLMSWEPFCTFSATGLSLWASSSSYQPRLRRPLTGRTSSSGRAVTCAISTHNNAQPSAPRPGAPAARCAAAQLTPTISGHRAQRRLRDRRHGRHRRPAVGLTLRTDRARPGQASDMARSACAVIVRAGFRRVGRDRRA